MTAWQTQTVKTMAPSVADDLRWGAYCSARQDSGWAALVSGINNGRLLLAVVPSRTANPINVQLHDTLESAKATGSVLANGVTRTARRSNARMRAWSRRRAGLSKGAKKNLRWRT